MNAPKVLKHCPNCDEPMDDAQVYCSDKCEREFEQKDKPLNRRIIQVTVTSLIRTADGTCYRSVKMVSPSQVLLTPMENESELGTYVQIHKGSDWQWMGRVEKVSTPEQADEDKALATAN